ncbi:MAG TPA: preprotein translocase subunit SecG [Candidatus Paceibacterota bacterium]|nr:preprotein translocase subunit SecG [Candidatus Paceibacterota bacterium]
MQILATYLPIIQVGLSVLLIVAILLQRSEADLGSAFGGATSTNPLYAKRGIEKHLFVTTIILAILFVASTLVALFV